MTTCHAQQQNNSSSTTNYWQWRQLQPVYNYIRNGRVVYCNVDFHKCFTLRIESKAIFKEMNNYSLSIKLNLLGG